MLDPGTIEAGAPSGNAHTAHRDRLGLAEPVGAVLGLLVLLWIEITRQEDDVVELLQVEANAARADSREERLDLRLCGACTHKSSAQQHARVTGKR